MNNISDLFPASQIAEVIDPISAKDDSRTQSTRQNAQQTKAIKNEMKTPTKTETTNPIKRQSSQKVNLLASYNGAPAKHVPPLKISPVQMQSESKSSIRYDPTEQKSYNKTHV